jgi:hypothetical protein
MASYYDALKLGLQCEGFTDGWQPSLTSVFMARVIKGSAMRVLEQVELEEVAVGSDWSDGVHDLPLSAWDLVVCSWNFWVNDGPLKCP